MTPDRSAANLLRLAAALRDLGGGYADLIRDAEAYEVGTARILVASLSDVIRSKTAAGRQKDLVALPELISLVKRKANPSA